MMELQQWDILLRLAFAHVLCDFVFQSDAMIRKKESRDLRTHLLHSLLHANLAYIFSGCWRAWYIWLVIFLTHVCLDYLKICFKKKICSFLIDQLLHFLIIFLLWIVITGQWLILKSSVIPVLSSKEIWILVVGYLLVLTPSSILLGLFTQRWSGAGQVTDSLKKAGQWIGYLERTLIFVFIQLGQLEAIGFLLAAKSIFRFGELNKSKEIKSTEYVLIGTLSSFALAIVIGLVVRYLLPPHK